MQGGAVVLEREKKLDATGHEDGAGEGETCPVHVEHDGHDESDETYDGGEEAVVG